MPDSETSTSAEVADEALAGFVLLAGFHGVPADPGQIHHDRGKGDVPYDFDDLLRIAKKLGLIARRRKAELADLVKLPLPALMTLADGGTAILLKVDETGETGVRYLVMTAKAERPAIWSEADLAERTGGAAELLLMTSREHIAGEKRAFDVSWFIPALVKYRKPLRDVL